MTCGCSTSPVSYTHLDVYKRQPESSSNPVLRDIIQRKPKVVLFNKSDMADPAQTSKWIAHYAAQGEKAIPLESKTGKGINAFYPAVREVLKPQDVYKRQPLETACSAAKW